MFFAVQKVSKLVVDVNECLEGLVSEYGVGCWVVYIVEHRLVVDEGRWDGLAMKGRWRKDKRQKTNKQGEAISLSKLWAEHVEANKD